LCVQNDREWVSFCRHVLHAPEVAVDRRFHDNPARIQNRAALDHIITAAFAQLTEARILARLVTGGIAYGHPNSLNDGASHPHLRTLKVKTAGGEVHVIAPAPIADDEVERNDQVPTLGEHSMAIRAEFTESGQPPAVVCGQTGRELT